MFRFLSMFMIVYSSFSYASSTLSESDNFLYLKAKILYGQNRYLESRSVLEKITDNQNANVAYLHASTYSEGKDSYFNYYDKLIHAANLGSLWAMRLLVINEGAIIYENSEKLKGNLIDFLTNRDNTNNGQALSLMASIDSNTFSDFIFWTKKAADKGHAPSQYHLAKYYRSGEGFFFFESNRKKEIDQLFASSAKSGYHDALRAVAFTHIRNNETSKGLEILNKLINKGDAATMFILGLMYQDGDTNLGIDLNKSFYYLYIYINSTSNEFYSPYLNLAMESMESIKDKITEEVQKKETNKATIFLDEHDVYEQMGIDEYEYTVDQAIASQLLQN